jgi:hypothetical protein
MYWKKSKSIRLEEDSYHHLYEYAYNPLVRYYQDAAEKVNAMFLHFG